MSMRASAAWAAECGAVGAPPTGVRVLVAGVVEEEEAADWRNRAVHDRVKTFNVGRAAGGRAGDKGRAMEVLPLAKYTKEAADLHTCHQVHQHDCTHLCFTPLLWQPLWHDLIRLAKTMPL